jgi:hypothetical protein
MNMQRLAHAAVCVALLIPTSALAETYEVGAGKPYATITEVLPMLVPGDVVEVQGDATYAGDLWFRAEQSGTPEQPVTVRGVRVNGKRPIIQGVGTEQWHNYVVLLNASDFVFEGFEIAGDLNPENTGIVHKGNRVTVRDVVVHDVANQGLIGTDFESGSLTLENSEFYNNGEGDSMHQIYMATDETMYPGAVFRMQGCYVHDGRGGNNVKSRSERNEIYSNWIEGAFYHELDLIGPDGQDPGLAREDSDIVGNVLVKHSEWLIARIGGDGTGNTAGRYRFSNNTMVLSNASPAAIVLQQTVESVELHNNVIVQLGGPIAKVWATTDEVGPAAQLFGSNNWVQDGITDVPAAWVGTVGGVDPGFVDGAGFDFRLVEGSALIDAGTMTTTGTELVLANPLMFPETVPPSRELGTGAMRPADAAVDIGAFEFGTGSEPGEGGIGGGSPNGSGGGDADDAEDGGLEGGCDCSLGGHAQPGSRVALVALALAALLSRRSRR